MGQFGSNGTSMHDDIENNVNIIEYILDSSNLAEKEKNTIIDIVKDMAYQWCSSNATACAMESAYRLLRPEDEDLRELIGAVLAGDIRNEVFNKTYPFQHETD